MPSKQLKKWADEAKVSVDEAEKKWDECKEYAHTKFDKEDEAFWSYVNVCTRKKLGIYSKEEVAAENRLSEW